MRVRRSWAPDDLVGVRQIAAEAEQQDGVAGADGTLFDEFRERERDAGGRGVARLDDIAGDDRVDGADLLGEGLDDAQVRLVEDDTGEVGGVRPAFSQALRAIGGSWVVAQR